MALDRLQGLDHARNEPDLARICQQIDVLDEDAITIEEERARPALQVVPSESLAKVCCDQVVEDHVGVLNGTVVVGGHDDRTVA